MNNLHQQKDYKYERMIYVIAVHIVAINLAAQYISDENKSVESSDFFRSITTHAEDIIDNMPINEFKKLADHIHYNLLNNEKTIQK